MTWYWWLAFAFLVAWWLEARFDRILWALHEQARALKAMDEKLDALEFELSELRPPPRRPDFFLDEQDRKAREGR